MFGRRAKTGGVVAREDILARRIDRVAKQLNETCGKLGFGTWSHFCGIRSFTFSPSAAGAFGELRDKITTLEARLKCLECAARGHGYTKTVTEDATRVEFEEAGCPATYTRPGFTGDVCEQGIRTTITCLDCGATISDDWKAEEVDDG